ncbi:hypothetical protein POP15_022 [Pectobacterium phage POP15]|nr:hypothetical protein POP15_022 [Pectobacterium phage POP15]
MASYENGVYVPSTEQEKKMKQSIDDWKAGRDRKEKAVANAKAREDIQYTMFVSGLRRGRLNEFEKKNQVDDLAILFDAVTQHSYTKEYNKSSYAVESKARASDHVTTKDGKFTFTAVITDSPYLIDQRNIIDRDTDKDNPAQARRPSKAVEILETVADSHQLVTLVTEDNILTNYVITSFQADRSNETGSSISVQVTLEEFRFKMANKTVMARTADPKKAGNANSGTKQTAEGGAVDDSAKAKRQTPYIGKNAAAKERLENAAVGTTDFSGKPGAKLPFDPNSLLRK